MRAQLTVIPEGARDAARFRTEIRRAYRCDCDGVSQLATEQPTARARGPVAELDAIELLLGERPATCPWRAFFDRDVQKTIKAHDFFESGQCREFWGDDPEWWLVEAVRDFHGKLNTVRADVLELERKRPTTPQPSLPIPGRIVQEIRQ